MTGIVPEGDRYYVTIEKWRGLPEGGNAYVDRRTIEVLVPYESLPDERHLFIEAAARTLVEDMVEA